MHRSWRMQQHLYDHYSVNEYARKKRNQNAFQHQSQFVLMKVKDNAYISQKEGRKSYHNFSTCARAGG